MEEINISEPIEKYTEREGGEWIVPQREILISDIIGCSKINKDVLHVGWVWQDPRQFLLFIQVHSFITKSGVRYDAHNNFLTDEQMYFRSPEQQIHEHELAVVVFETKNSDQESA